MGLTTGYSRFAECQGHSANAQKHSANTLPSVTLGIQHTALICRQTVVCRVFFIGHSANSLPSVSKHSAKINSRQKKIDGMERRCRFCRVHDGKHSAKFLNFAECQKLNTRQSFQSLPSVRTKTLGKQAPAVRFYGHFAECPLEYTRQRRLPEWKMVSFLIMSHICQSTKKTMTIHNKTS